MTGLIHIYTGMGTPSRKWWQPWRWDKALLKLRCPKCKGPVAKEALGLGMSFVCLSCPRQYFYPLNWPMNGKIERITFTERDAAWVRRFIRGRAYEEAQHRVDDYGRSTITGRFVRWPRWKDYRNMPIAEARQVAKLEAV